MKDFPITGPSKTYEPFGALAFSLATLLIIVLIFRWTKHSRNTLSIYFFLSSLTALLLILLSHWSAQMDFPVRYYISASALIWLALIFGFDKGQKVLIPRVVLSMALVLVAVSGFYRMKYWGYHVDNRITVHQARELATTENIGIIGDYWNSYLIEAINPSGIDATPHDRDLVRNQNSLKTIFSRDSIMLVGLGFTDTFPHTLQQFGANLYRSSRVIDEPETR